MIDINKLSFARNSPKKQIDPVCFVISTEGLDEQEYFKALEKLIPRRFNAYYRLLSVEKSDPNHSSIEHVCNDLKIFLDSGRGDFRNSYRRTYIVFDHDKNFQPNHIGNTITHIRESRQKGHTVIYSNSCFEIWLIAHYIDIEDLDIKDELLANRNNFAKQYLHRVRQNETFHEMVRRYKKAIEHAIKLSQSCTEPQETQPSTTLRTDVYLILQHLIEARLLE